jgi:hypothetical protein
MLKMFQRFFQSLKKNSILTHVLNRKEESLDGIFEIELDKIKTEELEEECSCCFTNKYDRSDCPHPNCSYTMCEQCILTYKDGKCPHCRQSRFDSGKYEKYYERKLSIDTTTGNIYDRETQVLLGRLSQMQMEEILAMDEEN